MKPEVRWPLFIVGLLALQILFGIFFVWRATSDPSFAVEEDYYRKAVNWEETQAQRSRNQALGWSVDERLVPPPVLGGKPTLEVTLTDAEGQPISGATVEVETFHNVRASAVLRAVLVEREPGVYAAEMAMTRPGLWEIRTTVDHAGERFTHATKSHLDPRPR